MSITDSILLALSIFLLFRGSSRGFMNSLINPFSIIVTSILSIIYYQDTKNLMVSLAIGTIGPFFLNFLLKIILRFWSKATNTDVKPNFLSRLGGAILTLIWGWVFVIFVLILLAVLPSSWGQTLTAIHHDVTQSISYCRVAKPLEKYLFPAVEQNSPAVTNAPSGSDVKSLVEDPRFQKILQDPEIQNEINAHDFVKLMQNPKMLALTQQIMSDPATMKKVFALYNSQTQVQTNSVTSNSSN